MKKGHKARYLFMQVGKDVADDDILLERNYLAHPKADLVFLRIDEASFAVGAKDILGKIIHLLMVFSFALHRNFLGNGQDLQTLRYFHIVRQ